MSEKSTNRILGLAIGQLGPVQRTDSRESVVERLINLMRRAKSRGAEIVVFPELALTTFFPRYWTPRLEDADPYYERSMPNATVQPLFDEAKRLSIGFYLGYAELTADGHRYNTAVLVDQHGDVVGKYRKIHLPGHMDHKPDAPFQHLEKRYFEVGDLGFGVFETHETRFGLCICNDRRWPETYRVMALQSAEVLLLGYNTPLQNIHWNEPAHLRTSTHLLVLQANAYENGLWVAAAAKCGVEDGCAMIGSSVIVAPSGEIVARTVTEGDEIICVEADLALGAFFREHVFNFARHRRPEHYRLIVERTAAGEPLPVSWQSTLQGDAS